jgi:hypothetical protein
MERGTKRDHSSGAGANQLADILSRTNGNGCSHLRQGRRRQLAYDDRFGRCQSVDESARAPVAAHPEHPGAWRTQLQEVLNPRPIFVEHSPFPPAGTGGGTAFRAECTEGAVSATHRCLPDLRRDCRARCHAASVTGHYQRRAIWTRHDWRATLGGNRNALFASCVCWPRAHLAVARRTSRDAIRTSATIRDVRRTVRWSGLLSRRVPRSAAGGRKALANVRMGTQCADRSRQWSILHCAQRRPDADRSQCRCPCPRREASVGPEDSDPARGRRVPMPPERTYTEEAGVQRGHEP